MKYDVRKKSRVIKLIIFILTKFWCVSSEKQIMLREMIKNWMLKCTEFSVIIYRFTKCRSVCGIGGKSSSFLSWTYTDMILTHIHTMAYKPISWEMSSTAAIVGVNNSPRSRVNTIQYTQLIENKSVKLYSRCSYMCHRLFWIVFNECANKFIFAWNPLWKSKMYANNKFNWKEENHVQSVFINSYIVFFFLIYY